MPEPLRRYTFARMKNGKLQIPTLVAASAALFFCSSLSAQGWSGDAPSASSSPESGSSWGNSANDPWVDSSASETEAPESSPAQDDPWGGSSEEASQDDPASDPSSSGWDFSQMPSNLNPELSLTGPSTSSSWRLAGYSSGDFTLNLDDLGLSASADFEVGQFSDLGDSEWGRRVESGGWGWRVGVESGVESGEWRVESGEWGWRVESGEWGWRVKIDENLLSTTLHSPLDFH